MIGADRVRPRVPRCAPSRQAVARGFSLLEMIVVLVILGVVAGLVAPMVSRSAGLGRERRAVGELVTVFSIHRLSAIQTGQTVAVELTPIRGGALRVRAGESDRLLDRFPLVLIDAAGDTQDGARIVFGPRGRADLGALLFRSASERDRLWTIEFDPVGGVPTARRHTEASQP